MTPFHHLACRLFGHSFQRIINGFHWYRTEQQGTKVRGQYASVRCTRCDKYAIRYTGDSYYENDGRYITDNMITSF